MSESNNLIKKLTAFDSNISLSTLFNLLYFPSKILMGKYFRISKNGQKKCPKIENPKYFAQKSDLCDHN